MAAIASTTIRATQVGAAAPGVRAGHLLTLMLIVAAFVDVPALIGLGPVSGMGALTIAEAAIAAAAVLALRVYPRRVVLPLVPYGAFLAWATVTIVWTPPSFGGLQNWIVYMLFALVALTTATLVAYNAAQGERAIEGGVRCMDVIALTLFGVSVLAYGLPSDGIMSVVGARPFALLGLLPMSWHVARWIGGYPRNGVFAWLWLLAIGLSLSRTATAIALFYMGIALVLQIRWSARSLLLRVPLTAVATSVVVIVLARSTPMADRLFTGDMSLRVGGVAVNASGRVNIWSTVIESAWTSPVSGHGLGSSMGIASTFFEIGHPHNDYLRVWHDLGFIGLTLFAVAFAWLFANLLRKTERTLGRTEPAGSICLAAVLGLTGVLIACVTDNAIIYPFVMAPLGVLVGAAIGIRVDVHSAGSS